MTKALLRMLASEAQNLEQAGLYKREVVLPSGRAAGGLDMTGYDYLGLAEDPRLREAASLALAEYGVGVSSSRCFSGTREVHRQLEGSISKFLGTPAAIVFGSGYVANQALFGALFDSRDCVFCDAWIHPSVAEGIRLCGARAIPYRNDDLEDLQDKLKRSRAARFRTIVTEGVYSFSGRVARLAEICELAERYDALVIVDDALAVGALGAGGRGSVEHRRVKERVQVVTGSFSMALGGGAGGFVAGSAEVVDWLRQKASAYLFSGALPPVMAAVAAQAVELLAQGQAPLATLAERVKQVSAQLTGAGLKVLGGEHPNIVLHVGSAVVLQKLVSRMLEHGVRVCGLCYPVVPEREARLRIQVSVKHDQRELEKAMRALIADAQTLGVVGAP